MILLGILVQLPCVAVRIGILLVEFLHFLLNLGVKDFVVVGGHAVKLGFPCFGILVVGLQRCQHVFGQVGCGVVLGLGVGQKGVQEEQEDE